MMMVSSLLELKAAIGIWELNMDKPVYSEINYQVSGMHWHCMTTCGCLESKEEQRGNYLLSNLKIGTVFSSHLIGRVTLV